MAEKILGEQGSRRRRRFLWVPMLTIAALALFLVSGAQAVHDLQFQLDGDVVAGTATNIGAGTQSLDWASLFDSSGGQVADSLNTTAPFYGFNSSDFRRDFLTKPSDCTLATLPCAFDTADHTTFATGSKDTLNITPGWQCNQDNNVNSKIDIMNAYAAAYTTPGLLADPPPAITTSHHQILYFGMEKNKNNGDNNVAFWFLQSGADCSSTGPNTPWTGTHTDGDILIVSAFTSGGGVSNITAYRWNGSSPGSLGTTAVANGGDCKIAPLLDSICATSNSGPNPVTGLINTPWLTANSGDGVGTTLQSTEFFEGGIDLTANNLGGKCFNTFVGDTRSSQSLTATLFDYTRGVLGECKVVGSTTPSQTTRVLGSTDPITDLANISGTDPTGAVGPTPTGTVSFFLCGPGVTGCLAATTPQSAVTGNPVNLGACTPVAAGHACARSGDAQALITGVGTYCFRAVYDPGTDSNYAGKGGSFDGSGECFTVTAVATTTTTQKWLPQDSAHVTATGGATVAGSVVFKLYESTSCSGTAVQTFGSGTVADPTINVDASGNATTSNTTYYVDTNKQISWQATFTSSNSVGSGTAGPCERSDIANLDDDISTP